uniref:Acetyltransf_18 domain-containing protein n=1 Tax=Strongyloides stercoralis TaxID=6248 RepID=A0A0K0EB34_STRER
MLAIQDIENLFKNTLTNETLSGIYLPLNNNPSFLEYNDVTAIMIVKKDENNKSCPVAFGETQKITNNQYYAMINIVDEEYLCQYVSVNHNKTFRECWNNKNLSILSLNNTNLFSNNLNNDNNNSISLPFSTYIIPYYTVFGDKQIKPLLEILFEETIKKLNIYNNFYVNKNMTIDIIYEGNIIKREEEEGILRNFVGFNVIDKMYIQKCTYNVESLKEFIEDCNEYYINNDCIEIDKSNLQMVTEYDKMIIGMERKDYLKHLFKLGNVEGLVQINDKGIVDGYILKMNNHIIGCYGKNEKIQINLIKSLLSKFDDTTEITFFINCQENFITTKLLRNALELNEVRRLHTSTLINKINWEKVGIIGIGCHVF